MRICYLILLHHKLEQAARMIERLAGPNVSLVVHIDQVVPSSQAEKLKDDLKRYGAVFYAKRKRAKWGSYGQVDAIVQCIKAAALNDKRCDRYILLSGQDYPIVSRREIEDFFSKSQDMEFLEARGPLDTLDVSATGWTPFYRFRRYHVWLGNRKLAVPLLRKRAPDVPIFHGSTWWALSRSTFLYLADEIDRQRRFLRFLKHGFLVDEILVPSILMLSPFADRLTRNNITHAVWTPTSGPHPKTLTIGDLEEMASSGKLFARKFDAEKDSEVLDLLDVKLCPLGR